MADQLVQIAQFFHFDGWLINIENSLSVSRACGLCLCHQPQPLPTPPPAPGSCLMSKQQKPLLVRQSQLCRLCCPVTVEQEGSPPGAWSVLAAPLVLPSWPGLRSALLHSGLHVASLPWPPSPPFALVLPEF